MATAVRMDYARWLGVATVTGAVLVGLSSRADTAGSAVHSALHVPPERAKHLRDRALSETLERDVLQAALASQPSTESVSDYYRRFESHYVKPEAIEVWRILCPSEQQAKGIISNVKSSSTPQRTWSLAAREHSLDKATHFRKGHLGFVRANGATDVPQVRVSPAVFEAARTLEDGAFSQVPYREGENWGVVWRRGTRKEQRRTLDEAREEIVQQLSLAAARTSLAQLLATLRAERLTDYHPELVESLPAVPDAGFQVRRTPRLAHPADAHPTPRKTDWGER